VSRIALAVSVVALLVGCARQPNVSAAPALAPAAQVYAALLRPALAAGEQRLLVFDSTSAGEPGGSRFVPARRAAFWAALPRGLAEQLDSAIRTPRALRAVGLPRWIQLIDRREWAARLEAEARRGEIDLGSVYVVSPVVFSADSTAALVYMEQPCRGSCGRGAFYHLRRDSAGTWRLEATEVAWSG
jgi:hypothetical protein